MGPGPTRQPKLAWLLRDGFDRKHTAGKPRSAILGGQRQVPMQKRYDLAEIWLEGRLERSDRPEAGWALIVSPGIRGKNEEAHGTGHAAF